MRRSAATLTMPYLALSYVTLKQEMLSGTLPFQFNDFQSK
jgi:hypothetical protein